VLPLLITDDYLNHPDEELDKDEDEEDPIEDEDEDEKDLLSFSPLRTSTSPRKHFLNLSWATCHHSDVAPAPCFARARPCLDVWSLVG
tara:strand:- start:3046 stop:3309 length:264 start_codon:yes stop_codon:yes gene_type:complete